jgi:Glycosyltransferase
LWAGNKSLAFGDHRLYTKAAQDYFRTELDYDPIYDKEVLGILGKNCYAYIHAYEVGGTNPSLLEQMLFKKPIIAYDVPFHREVLQGGGIYFKDEDGLANCIERLENDGVDSEEIGKWQVKRTEEEYNWGNVAEEYSSLFKTLIGKSCGEMSSFSNCTLTTE